MKVDKVIEKFYFRLQLDENEAEILLAILEKVTPNSKKFRQSNNADLVSEWRDALYKAGIKTDDAINGELTFPEF